MPKPHPLFEKPDAPGTREAGKIVLIGQAPSKAGAASGRAAIGGPVGSRVASLLMMDLKAYVRRFRRLNLVQDHPGKAGRGDAFPVQEAEAAWAKLKPNLNGRRVVLLGAKVADVVMPKVGMSPGWRAVGWCCPFVTDGMTFMVLPHPSGLNQWWNDPARVQTAREQLKDFCHAR